MSTEPWALPADETIAMRYAKACGIPSDIHEHLPTFVQLVKDLHATAVVELGTRGAVSTLAWLYALDMTDGHLWSVDLDVPPALPTDRWTFIQGDDVSPAVFRQVPTADIVFIDTSHMYVHTVAELNLYRHKVRPGGKLVLHDTELAQPIGWTRRQPLYPVKTAVEEFCADEGFQVEYHPNCFGLAIVSVT